MQLQKIKETCLYVKDLERTQAFYNGLLGLPVISFKAGRHVFFRAGEDVLLCFLPEATKDDTHLPRHFGYGEQHFAFECKVGEYHKWKQNLKDLNIEIEHEEDWGRGFLSVYFRDPDNHCLEIVMPGMWDN
jgi:catechol 2,3-dioxygenase-like lactoylglutathione lyase family enzyme